MKRHYILVLLSLTLLLSPAVTAQESATPAAFVSELTAVLQAHGWSASETTEFQASASTLEWPQARGTTVEAVAFALAYYRDRSGDTAEAAVVAHGVAGVASTMEESGFGPLEIGRAVVEGTRDALSDYGDADTRPSEGNIAESVRENSLSRVRDQMRIIASGRGPEAARMIMNRISELSGPGDFVGYVPGGHPNGPLD